MRRELCQHFTPVWAAEALIDQYFPRLGSSDLVVEPSCGDGAFLKALPAYVPAVGVEIDPVVAERARRATGREVVVGDFRTVPLALRPTAVIGNPPFKRALFEQMLARCHDLLPDGAAAGFIVPAYFLQTPSTVLRFAEKWSLRADHIPRTIFADGSGTIGKPLVFAMFRKDLDRVLVGFALHRETAEVAALPPEYRDLLRAGARPVWRAVLVRALAGLGGEADLDSIYRAVEGARPTATRWWREQVRKQLQTPHFRRTGEARYAFAA